MQKPTLRRSGEMMITVAVKAHLTASWMREVVAHSHEFNPNLSLSKKAIEEIIRRDLLEYGMSHFFYWHENALDAEERREWATQQILRNWPELASDLKEDLP